jgi:hypothetical protein
MMPEQDYRFSSTSDYMMCRRKFMLGYIYEIESIPWEGRDGSPAEIGTMGHAGMAELYRGKTLDEALIAVHAEATKLGLSGKEGEEIAIGAVKRYVSWNVLHKPDKHMKTLLVEERLRVKIGTFYGHDVYITGAMDLVQEDDLGGLHIVDHKFTANFAYLAGSIELNRQGKTYAYLVQQHLGRNVDTFTLNMVLRKPLKKSPTIVADRLTVYIDQDEIEAHVRYLAVVAEEMVRLHLEVNGGDETRAFPNPGNHCSWCPFKNVCPTMDSDPDEAKEIISVKFRKKEELL